ncbi:hypothetical protein SUGI_1144830 [Cryptomeria japonica]|uniref:uncharacterized protein LOC131859798 isoform X1 n=1 Tax=Cryptomeria japonica TaxID=3369 RepID=UPI002414C6F4|nr:uncharacterized protein LOC131859798 isoform X1 [Cryptomeria japonica]GLJ53667.1 hypothetical protein SUGI_1144830 [Cryptomeria japonica]
MVKKSKECDRIKRSRECFTYTSVLISDVDLLLEPTDQPPKEKYSVQLEGKTYLPVFASAKENERQDEAPVIQIWWIPAFFFSLSSFAVLHLLKRLYSTGIQKPCFSALVFIH